MKKAILTIFIIAFSAITAGAQWTKISAGTSRQLNKVFFPSKNAGYIVPFRGLLLRTLDGGQSWDSLSSMETSAGTHHAGPNDIFFLNDSVGFIATLDQNKPRVFKTTDKGSTNTWQDITPKGAIYGTLEVHFLSEKTGYLFNNNGFDDRLWRTADGGQNWTELPQTFSLGSGTGSLPTMFFTGENTGYIAGGDGTFEYRGMVARTNDGGQNWSFTRLPQYSVIHAMHFPNKDTGYVISGMWEKAKVFRTTNAGAAWDGVSAPDSFNGHEIFFIDGKTGFALSESAIYKTTDAGTSWTYQNAGTIIPMRSIFFTDKNNGFIVGDSGLLLKTTNGGVAGIEQNDEGIRPKIFPNPSAGVFTFRIDKADFGTIEISDGLGHVILSEKIQSATRIDLSTQPGGVYYYRIIGKTISTGKLIKN